MCVKTNQEDQNSSPKPSKPSTNPPQARAGRVMASGSPQGQGQHLVAPSETQAQADGRAQSQAEDELDEGKRLRPKINTNLVRRGTGGFRQKRADFFSFEPGRDHMGSRSESSQLAVSGSGPGYDPDLVLDSQPPLQGKIRSLRLSGASLSHCRLSRKRPEERPAGPEGGERVAQASSSLERPKPGGGGGERGTGDFGGEIGGERSEFLSSARVLQNFENLTELVQNITRHNQNPEKLLIYKKTRRDRGLVDQTPGRAPLVLNKKETKKQKTERGSPGPGATSNSRLVARSGSGTTVPKFPRVSSNSNLKLPKSLKPGACTQDTKLDPEKVLGYPNLKPDNRPGIPIILAGWGEVEGKNEVPG